MRRWLENWPGTQHTGIKLLFHCRFLILEAVTFHTLYCIAPSAFCTFIPSKPETKVFSCIQSLFVYLDSKFFRGKCIGKNFMIRYCNRNLEKKTFRTTSEKGTTWKARTGRRARKSLCIYLTVPRTELKFQSIDPKCTFLKHKRITRGEVKAQSSFPEQVVQSFPVL